MQQQLQNLQNQLQQATQQASDAAKNLLNKIANLIGSNASDTTNWLGTLASMLSLVPGSPAPLGGLYSGLQAASGINGLAGTAQQIAQQGVNAQNASDTANSIASNGASAIANGAALSGVSTEGGLLGGLNAFSNLASLKQLVDYWNNHTTPFDNTILAQGQVRFAKTQLDNALKQVQGLQNQINDLQNKIDQANYQRNADNDNDDPKPPKPPKPHPAPNTPPNGVKPYPWWPFPWPGFPPGPQDPNDIIGPPGFGDQHFISPQSFDYTVLFQNEPTATAPAQHVTITEQLDPHLDPRSFRLGDFGWGGQTFMPPANSSYYQTTIDEGTFNVIVTATIDVADATATWDFQIIDPSTGLPPTDGTIGFLPPDDSSGSGEAFVTYSVSPLNTVKTGDVINAQASIVFDTNPPLDTPQIFNTIDTGSTLSSTITAPANSPSTQFVVSWAPAAKSSLSAIANYSIYVSDDGGTFTELLANTTATQTTFTGQKGHTYKFYSLATDNADNTQSPASATTITTIVGDIVQTLTAAAPKPTEGAAITPTVATFTGSDSSGTTSDFSASIVWGDGQSSAGAVVGSAASGYSVTGSHTYLEEGSYVFDVIVTDVAGSHTITGTAVVADAALSATAGATLAGTEGSTLSGTLATFTDADPGGAATDYTAVVNWGDSTTTTVTGSQITDSGGNFGVPGSHAYALAGNYTITVTVSDHGSTATVKPVATVSDATLNAAAATFAATEGKAVSQSVATFTDGNPLATTGNFTATVDWGDTPALTTVTGSQITEAGGTFSVPASHAYLEEGTYTLTVTIKDEGGTSITIHPVADVADASLSAAVAPVATTEGTPFNGTVATFTDADPNAAASDYTATIDWGDQKPATTISGTQLSESGGTFTVASSHVYAEAGAYTMTVTVADHGGATVTVSPTAVIADAALTAGTVAPVGVTEGVTFTGTVGSFTDANQLAVASDFSATITWSDGSSVAGNVVSAAGTPGAFDVIGTHLFSDETASSPISMVVHDAGGNKITLSGSAVVNDAPLTPTAVTFDAVAGVTFTGKVAAFSDANTLATASDFSATINWGDNQTTTLANIATASGGGFVVSGSHAYSQATTRTVIVVVHDKGGAATTVTSSAIFADLVATASPVAISPVEGATFSGPLATFTGTQPGGTSSDFSAQIVWGDGQSTAGNISGTAAAGYTVSGSHAYQEEAASVPLAIVLRDQIGNLTTISNATKIVDATLVATASGISGTEGASFSVALATFTDADPAGTVSDYTAVITWGDPTTSTSGTVTAVPGGGFAVSGAHVYEEGTFTYTVTIQDAGGSMASVTAAAVIADAPLSGTSASIAAGTTVSGTVATFSDPDTADMTTDYTAIIDWGDGSGTSVGSVSASGTPGAFDVTGDHTYTDANPHTITITVNHGTDQPLVIHSPEPGNPVPFVVTDHTYVIGSGTITVSAADGLLTHDTAPTQLSATAGTLTGAEGGTFVVNADGSFTYTPGGSFPGYDNTQVTITDASGDKGTTNLYVLSQHAGVVWKFYESVLNRTPDPAGLQYWTNYFDNGGSTGDMAFGFFESDELLDKVLGNYYEQYLLRPLDPAGLAYWKGVWHATGGPEQIKAGFADSPEFYNSSGGTPDSWIDALYQRILSRPPDPDGKTFWLNYYQQQVAAGVDAGTVRYQIALGFFDSSESYGQDVNGWFEEYLFRTPTAGEQAQYVSQMEGGANDRTIEQEITNLPEYASNPPTPADGSAQALGSFYQTTAQSQAVVAAKDAFFGNL